MRRKIRRSCPLRKTAVLLLLAAGSVTSAAEWETIDGDRQLLPRQAGGERPEAAFFAVIDDPRHDDFATWVAPDRSPDDALAELARGSVFVYLEPALDSESAERRGVREFARDCGGSVRFEYETVLPDVINLRGIPEIDVEALRLLPGVARVEMDRPFRIQLNHSAALVRALESDLQDAGFSTSGAGVRVCIIDSGIDSDHTLYADRIDTAAGTDVFNGDSNPEDDNGHGSHVAGIAVGGVGQVDVGEGPVPFQGIAPGATLIGVKTTNQNGEGLSSLTIAAIDHCASPSLPNGRADVINLSIGSLTGFSDVCDGDPVAAAANAAVSQGLVIVAASGNEDFSNALISPACASGVIAVGATYDASYLGTFNFGICSDDSPPVDKVACFSNRSDNLDVSAPGCLTLSADYSASPNGLTTQCGTSQSTPHVAGLAALILEADPSLTPAAVRQVIRDGSIDLGPAGHDRGHGFGRIDALNSLALVTGCASDDDCDDNLFCNGIESCVDNECEGGTEPCGDGIFDRTDGCYEVFDACAQDFDGTFCEGDPSCLFFARGVGFFGSRGSAVSGPGQRRAPTDRGPGSGAKRPM